MSDLEEGELSDGEIAPDDGPTPQELKYYAVAEPDSPPRETSRVSPPPFGDYDEYSYGQPDDYQAQSHAQPAMPSKHRDKESRKTKHKHGKKKKKKKDLSHDPELVEALRRASRYHDYDGVDEDDVNQSESTQNMQNWYSMYYAAAAANQQNKSSPEAEEKQQPSQFKDIYDSPDEEGPMAGPQSKVGNQSRKRSHSGSDFYSSSSSSSDEIDHGDTTLISDLKNTKFARRSRSPPFRPMRGGFRGRPPLARAGGRQDKRSLKAKFYSEQQKLKDERYQKMLEEKKQLPCRFFMNGHCKKGDDCDFSHDISQDKKMDLCRFYLNGYCIKGSHCNFLHHEYPCKFFHIQNSCHAGDTCRFSHDELKPEMREILERSKVDDRLENEWRERGPRPPMMVGSPPQHVRDAAERVKPVADRLPSIFDIDPSSSATSLFSMPGDTPPHSQQMPPPPSLFQSPQHNGSAQPFQNGPPLQQFQQQQQQEDRGGWVEPQQQGPPAHWDDGSQGPPPGWNQQQQHQWNGPESHHGPPPGWASHDVPQQQGPPPPWSDQGPRAPAPDMGQPPPFVGPPHFAGPPPCMQQRPQFAGPPPPFLAPQQPPIFNGPPPGFTAGPPPAGLHPPAGAPPSHGQDSFKSSPQHTPQYPTESHPPVSAASAALAPLPANHRPITIHLKGEPKVRHSSPSAEPRPVINTPDSSASIYVTPKQFDKPYKLRVCDVPPKKPLTLTLKIDKNDPRAKLDPRLRKLFGEEPPVPAGEAARPFDPRAAVKPVSSPGAAGAAPPPTPPTPQPQPPPPPVEAKQPPPPPPQSPLQPPKAPARPQNELPLPKLPPEPTVEPLKESPRPPNRSYINDPRFKRRAIKSVDNPPIPAYSEALPPSPPRDIVPHYASVLADTTVTALSNPLASDPLCSLAAVSSANSYASLKDTFKTTDPTANPFAF